MVGKGHEAQNSSRLLSACFGCDETNSLFQSIQDKSARNGATNASHSTLSQICDVLTGSGQAMCKANPSRGSLKAQILHQARDGAARNDKAVSTHLMVSDQAANGPSVIGDGEQLSNAIDAEVFLKNTRNLGFPFYVSLRALRKALRVSALTKRRAKLLHPSIDRRGVQSDGA